MKNIVHYFLWIAMWTCLHTTNAYKYVAEEYNLYEISVPFMTQLARTPIGGVVSVGGLANGHASLFSSLDCEHWHKMENDAPFMPRQHSAVFSLVDSMFLMGGMRFMNKPEGDIWASDDSGVTWQLITEKAPWRARASPAVAVWEGDEGLFSVNKDKHKEDSSSSSSSSSEFSIRNKLWKDEYRVYLYGGIIEPFDERINDLWVWRIEKKSRRSRAGRESGASILEAAKSGVWEKIGASPFNGRRNSAMFFFHGELHLMGGKPLDSADKKDVWKISKTGEFTPISDDGPWNEAFTVVPLREKDALLVISSDGLSTTRVYSSTNLIDWQNEVEHPIDVVMHGPSAIRLGSNNNGQVCVVGARDRFIRDNGIALVISIRGWWTIGEAKFAMIRTSLSLLLVLLLCVLVMRKCLLRQSLAIKRWVRNLVTPR